MESIREKNERLRYELIEFIDYLSPTGGQTLLNLQDKIFDYYKDSGSANKKAAVSAYLIWLDDLAERGLIKILVSKEDQEQVNLGIFRIDVQQPALRDYLDDLYTHKQIKLEKLDYPTLFAAKKIVEELQDELLVTTERHVQISAQGDPDEFRLRDRALSFLKAYGAIEGYEYSSYTSQVIVTLRRRTFDVFVYTIAKHMRVIKKLDEIIQSSPDKPKRDTVSTTEASEPHIIFSLDQIPPKVEYQGKSFDVGMPSIELSILRQLNNSHPQAATHQDVIDDWGGTEKSRTVPDGCKRLNQKFRKLTSFKERAVINLNAELRFNSHFAERFLGKKVDQTQSDSD